MATTVHHPSRAGRGLSAIIALAMVISVAVVGQIAPTTATAAADANLVPIVAARLMDSRPGEKTVDGNHAGTGRVSGGTSYTLPVAGRGGVDESADAVMLNVTAVTPDDLGFLTVYPCTATVPNASHVNYFPGQIVPNSVLARVSDAGTVCIYTLANSDIIVDVTGYVPVGGAPVPVDPGRLVETRGGPNETTVDGRFEGVGRASAGSTVEFEATGRAGVPADAEAVYLNVTAIYPDAPGFLTVYPCGSPRPDTSNVNYGPDEVQPNAVLATVGVGGRVCIFTLADADIIADVNAYLPPGGNRAAIEPARCADTRPEGETFDGLFEGDGKIAPGGTYAVRVAGRCNIDAGASAAYLNVTAVNTEDFGFLTVWPCDEPRPIASNVNYGPGQISPNAVLSKVSLDGSGQVCIFSLARTDVIVDVNGYVPEAGLFGIESVSAGNRTTCALMSDATVRCAGDGGYTGDGTFDDVYDPTPVAGIAGAEVLEAADSHACAVLVDRTVRCWGSNSNGRLGDGTNEGDNTVGFARRVAPVTVVGLDDVIDISSQSSHTCVIVDDDGDDAGDTTWCWGRNNSDQLGDTSDADQFTPVPVEGLPAGKTPVDIGAGGAHTCVLYDDGTVWCWGHGARVGRITGSSAGQVPAEVTEVSNVTQLAVGGSHSCALIDDGSVECWGQNEDNALGQRDPMVSNLLPSAVLAVSGVIEVAAGQDSTCVRFADGTADCWGDNGQGQLGRLVSSDNEVAAAPMKTERAADIVQLSANHQHVCARLADSSVVCWGRYANGNLGVRLSGAAIAPVVYGSGDLRG